MKRIEFKVGQKVVALTSHCNGSTSIKRGVVYVVKMARYCCSCGLQAIGFGSPSTQKNSICINGHISPTQYFSAFSSSRFAPLDNLHESISEAAQNEDYELAQLLTEVLTENVELSELGI
jgi:hypothetical protein